MKKQQFNQFRDVDLIQPQRARLVIPAFILPVSAWAGASVILAEYPVGNSTFMSFKIPIRHFGTDFVAAVRYYDAVNDVIVRYKLWDDADAVLFYPVYHGEQLGANAVLEIWSINSPDFPTLDASISLETSILVFPPNQSCGTCCSQPSSEQLLAATEPSLIPAYAYCNPFCDGLCTP